MDAGLRGDVAEMDLRVGGGGRTTSTTETQRHREILRNEISDLLCTSVTEPALSEAEEW